MDPVLNYSLIFKSLSPAALQTPQAPRCRIVHNFRVKPCSPHCLTRLVERRRSGGCRIPNIFRTYNFIQKIKTPAGIAITILAGFLFQDLISICGNLQRESLGKSAKLSANEKFFQRLQGFARNLCTIRQDLTAPHRTKH